jgi:hypothetical protein
MVDNNVYYLVNRQFTSCSQFVQYSFIKPSTMLKKTLLFLFLLSTLFSQAQRKLIGDSILLSHDLSKFIPKGYIVIDTAIGNLNLDKYKDIILVVKAIGEDTAEYTWDYKRLLILLLGNSGKTFTFAARNDNILFTYDRSNPFGDSYEGIQINNGLFKIRQHSGGASLASEEEITFKFSITDKTWYLFKVVEESWTRNRTRKGIEKANNETMIYTQKHFGIVSIKNYHDWR